MPKTQTQRKGEIVYDLLRYGQQTIPQKEFEKTLEYNDVTNQAAQKDYTAKLIEGNYLTRVEGGFRLTDASRKEGIITIKVRPPQHIAVVARGLEAALGQFRPLTTMLIEVD
jgi:hypothetical protein